MSPNSTISPTFPASTQGEFWVRFGVTNNQTLLEIIPDGGTIDSVKIYEGSCSSLLIKKQALYPEADSIEYSFDLINYSISADYSIQLFSSTGANFTVILATAPFTSNCLTAPATCDLLCNLSFEEYSSGNIFQISQAQPWQEVTSNVYWSGLPLVGWCGYRPTSLLARTGDISVGLFTGFNLNTMPWYWKIRSVAGQTLLNPIPDGQWVYGELYVRRLNANPSCHFLNKTEGSTDLIEMYFSSGFPSNLSTHQPNPPVTAQISSVDANGNGLINPTTSTYQKVAGLFKVTQGAVDYLSIGYFRPESFSSSRLSSGADYAFSVVDDIFVQELPGAGESETFTCATLPYSVQIGTGMCDPSDPDLTFSWSPTAGLSNPNSLTPTATISQTTTYTLSVTYRGISYTDDITLTLEEAELQPRNIVVCEVPVYFTIPYYDPTATYTIGSVTGLHQYGYNVSNGKLEMFDVEFADNNYKGVSHIILESSNRVHISRLYGALLPCRSGR